MAWKKLPQKFTPKILEAITALSESGANKISIVRKLKLNINSFADFEEVNEAFLLGVEKLGENVRSQVLNNLQYSSGDRKLMIEKLGLFARPLHLNFDIVNSSTCNRALGVALKAYLAGDISDSTLEAFRKGVGTLSQAFIDTNIAERISEIEKILSERTKDA